MTRLRQQFASILTANDFLAKRNAVRNTKLTGLLMSRRNKLQQRPKFSSVAKSMQESNWHIEKTHSRYPRMLDTPYRSFLNSNDSRSLDKKSVCTVAPTVVCVKSMPIIVLVVPFAARRSNAKHAECVKITHEQVKQAATMPQHETQGIYPCVYSSSIKQCAQPEVHNGKNVNQCNSTRRN